MKDWISRALGELNPLSMVASMAPAKILSSAKGGVRNLRAIGKSRREEQNEKNKESERHYLVRAFWSLIFASVLLLIWPSLLPFGVWTLWKSNGSWQDWLYYCWPIFAWGGGITAFFALTTRNKPEHNATAESNFLGGFIISVFAGVTEEIAFRWCIFLFAAIMVQPVNWLLGGFIGFGIPELLQLYILGPVANFFTLGILKDVLVKPEVWYLGAGVIASNAAFRDGHKYLGLLGFVNSWFIGMVFFAVTFKFGLGAAILVHFLYDALIFFVGYLDQVVERAQGNTTQ